MTKDFNRELDQSQGEQHRDEARSKGRQEQAKPDHDPKVAREREGEGFDGPADEYAESGSRGAGYRETPGRKQATHARK
jgi:hypothetical protein